MEQKIRTLQVPSQGWVLIGRGEPRCNLESNRILKRNILYVFISFQLLVSGQPTTNSGSSPLSGGGSLSPGGALSPSGASSTGPAQCCESGRPLVTDPVTGQSVCSCQYDSARLAALQYRNAGVGVYGTPYPSTDQNPYPSIGVESSAFYSPLVSSQKICNTSHYFIIKYSSII